MLYERFAEPPHLATLPDPEPPAHGALIEVRATGVCRSDWHGWLGHDPDISVPHVPGHEFAGIVRAVGPAVQRWRGGERVTAPFVCACGTCAVCLAGDQQVCPDQTQPGFTHWGSFAQLVVVHHADVNLVALPDDLDDDTAAALGCRFATAFRAVLDVGHVRAGEWVTVHGCGGVGLSAVMIAAAAGARVVAVDVRDDALALARAVGAAVTIDARAVTDVGAAVREASGGGAHLSLDALGHADTARASIESLRRRGRHVQVGLLAGEQSRPALPMERVIAHELQVLGSHGMPAHRYPAMLGLIAAGRLAPERLIGRRIALEDAIEALTGMDRPSGAGVTVITSL
jgi:alcohol dehydrogenase